MADGGNVLVSEGFLGMAVRDGEGIVLLINVFESNRFNELRG